MRARWNADCAGTGSSPRRAWSNARADRLLVCDNRKEPSSAISGRSTPVSRPRRPTPAYSAGHSPSKLDDGDPTFSRMARERPEPNGYYLAVGEYFVPENNYETIREFMASSTDRAASLVTKGVDEGSSTEAREAHGLPQRPPHQVRRHGLRPGLLRIVRTPSPYLRGHGSAARTSLLRVLASTGLCPAARRRLQPRGEARRCTGRKGGRSHKTDHEVESVDDQRSECLLEIV